jgi:hypothetical protein
VSSVEIRRDLLEMEKLREELLTELARRHNWAEQERFWRENAEFWSAENRLGRARNYIALAAIVATVTAAAMAGMFAILTRFLP